MSLWMRDSERSDPALGSPPPPVRPFFPRDSNFVVWVRSRIRIYNNGSLYSDSGWNDDDWTPLASLVTLSYNLASKNSTVDVTSTLDIQTGGSIMPWQLVIEEVDSHSGTDVTSLTTHDIAPGSTTTISWSASLNHTLTANYMVLVPAEGA